MDLDELPMWSAPAYVLDIIECQMDRYCDDIVERAQIYIEDIKLGDPWRWLIPACAFNEVGDAAIALYRCQALQSLDVDISSRPLKRELEYAEKCFVQALHFNPHVREQHVCQLSYRNARYFGVETVWCESDGSEPNEVEALTNAALMYLRKLFAEAT